MRPEIGTPVPFYGRFLVHSHTLRSLIKALPLTYDIIKIGINVTQKSHILFVSVNMGVFSTMFDRNWRVCVCLGKADSAPSVLRPKGPPALCTFHHRK